MIGRRPSTPRSVRLRPWLRRTDAIRARRPGRRRRGRVDGQRTFEETPTINLNAGVRLELRGANEHRPTLIVSGPIDLSGGENAEITLNGLLIAGGPLRITSGAGNALRKLRIVHCTLVPGLSLGIDGTPAAPGLPSLLIEQTATPLEIEIDHSIVGAIRAPVNADV